MNQQHKNRLQKLRWIASVSLLVTTGFLIGILFTAKRGLDSTAVAVPASMSGIPNGESPFVAIAEKVKPSVVNIQVVKKGSDDAFMQYHRFPDFFFDPFSPFGDQQDNQKQRRKAPKATSGGSGFIVGTDGLIMTNNHVIENAEKITVKFENGKELTAEVVGRDPETDVAIIKVKKDFDSDLVLKWADSDKIHVGQWAIAVGNPFGLDWTVTVGVISALGRSNLPIAGGGPSFQDFIQTDASINFGNSGGPLLDIHGNVVGMNSAVNTQGQGIGFAIPANLAQRVMEQLNTKGKVTRGYLGLVPANFDEDKQKALKVPESVEGIFVDNVQENTPADKAGLRGGDVITQIEGRTFTDPTQFRLFVADHSPGDKMKLKVWRDDGYKNIDVILGDRSEYIAQGAVQEKETNKNWLGLDVSSVDGPRARNLRVKAETGVVIVRIENDSPAEEVLQVGDIILEVDRKKIESVSDWDRAKSDLKNRTEAILFRIQRGDTKTFVTVTPK